MNDTRKTNKTANANGDGSRSQGKITSRQVVALTGVILLALLYIVTLIVACVDKTASARWFWMCLFATIAIPLLIWIYTWVYGKLTGKHTLTEFKSENAESDQDAP